MTAESLKPCSRPSPRWTIPTVRTVRCQITPSIGTRGESDRPAYDSISVNLGDPQANVRIEGSTLGGVDPSILLNSRVVS